MTNELEAEVRALVEGYMESILEGLAANAEALRASPADPKVGQRVRSQLIDLERLVVIRAGLR